ncbi:MAG: serine/threonine protein kinase, partial [Pirellula sp.]|nr:serine/threonine protein kinase [Pirellula sp.]
MNVCPECSAPLRADGICSKCLLKLALEYRQSSSSPMDAGSLQQLNSQFPHLSILRMVGRGGMGTIYHARQTSLDRDVALKIIDRSISNDSTFLDRFEREAKALAKLSHPNIVSVFDYGHTSDGLAYFLMEFIHGLNLREAMQSMPIELAHSIEIIRSVADALNYAHSKGVVHRDIKPENILLSDDGRIKLADFGIAKINNAVSEKKITVTRQVLGTVHYLAPEQLEASNEVDHRVDIYALGVVFYELLTKQLPVGNFEPPSHINTAISRELDAVILKSLSRKPSLRFQTVDEFQQAVVAAIGKSSSVQPSVPWAAGPHANIPNQPAISVPFQCEGMNGFSRVHGAVQANETGIRVEYQSQDAFFGTWKSKLRTLELPWNRLVRVELKPGVFESKLQIYGDTFSLFQEFPGTEGGYLTVKVKKQNQDLADRFVDRVRQYHPSIVSDFNLGVLRHIPTNLTIALLLILCSFLNSGIVAILQVAAVESGFASSIKAMLSVAISVCIGPVILIQLFSGIIYAVTGNSKIGQVGVVASLLPLSPLFVFTLPFASWAKQELAGNLSGNLAGGSAASRSKYPRWGVTTMIFMKESRHATLVSALESAGGVLLVVAIVIWFAGAYPTKMQYRVVGNVHVDTMKTFIEERLYDCSGVSIDVASEQRFTIGCWRFQRTQIAQRLAITEKPNLVQCVTLEKDATVKKSSQDTASPAVEGTASVSDSERYVPIFES